MRRVVVTGIGIISSIGNDQTQVLQALKSGKSGIVFSEDYANRGFRCHVHGNVKLDIAAMIDKKLLRFMGDGVAYNYLAMQQAITDSGLEANEISHERTGLIMGSGGPSTKNLLWAMDTAREKGAKRVGPFMVPRTMSSTTSANLSTIFKIKGYNYTISSACSTSAHCVGNGFELIQWGKQDIVFAGGGEELDWTTTVLFDAMGALSSKYNATPELASRAYDADRDGFVIAGGGATLVLEERNHALARGAKIYGEIVGYGATSDGYDMVQPSGDGAVRCMKMALDGIDIPVDYINAHGTSTPAGDMRELQAVQNVFADQGNKPVISSTKSMTGHSMGATGAQEAIYSLLMMEHDFIAPSININNLDPQAQGIDIATQRRDNVALNLVISNSFGFGGTNSCLAFQKHTD